MNAALLVQYLLIAFAVAASAMYVAHKQFPDSMRRARIALALLLVRENRATWIRRVGRWIAPMPSLGEGSCGGCHGCGTKTS